MKITNNITVEVLQREVGITCAIDTRPILATTNVAMCTAFHGYNIEHKVGFLCHLDFPFTINVLPELAKKLEKLSGPGSNYQCEIHGGNRWTWARSPKTRALIEEQITAIREAGGVCFQIIHTEQLQPWFKRLAYAFDTRTGLKVPYPQRPTILSAKSLLLRSPAKFVYETKVYE